MKFYVLILFVGFFATSCKQDKSCKQDEPVALEAILVEYLEDIPYLMNALNIDSVLMVESRSEEDIELDTIGYYIRPYQNSVEFTYDTKEYKGYRGYEYDNLGLPCFLQTKSSISFKEDVFWVFEEERILRIVKNVKYERPDTSFFNFSRGRLINKLEKRGDIVWSKTDYTYNKKAQIIKAEENMIYDLNHHYHTITTKFNRIGSNVVEINKSIDLDHETIINFNKDGFPTRKRYVKLNGLKKDTNTFSYYIIN